MINPRIVLWNRPWHDSIYGMINKTQSVFLLFVLIAALPLLAQKETMHWYMNFNAHFDFSTNPPQLTTDSKIGNYYIYDSGFKINRPQTSNSISNKNGRMVMYSDGETIWDSSNNVMENGDNLLGNKCNLAKHNSVFVPLDLDSNIYYFFTCTNNFSDGCYLQSTKKDSVIYYHIIDLRLNNGKGAVISKNNRLNNFWCDNVVAVKHRNDVYTWIATRDKYGSAMVAWLLTPCGISPPVATKSFGYTPTSVATNLQFSPNGKMAAFMTYMDKDAYLDSANLVINRSYYHFLLKNNALALMDFDDSTGKFSHRKSIVSDNITFNTLCFSPQSKNIFFNGYWDIHKFSWLDLSSYSISALTISSPINYPTIVDNIQNTFYHQIYFSVPLYQQPEIDRVGNTSTALVNPDSIGATFNFLQNISTITGTFNGKLSYPNFVTSFFRPGYKTPDPYRMNPKIFGPSKVCFRDSLIFNSSVRDPLIDSLVWVVSKGDSVVFHEKNNFFSTVFPPGDYHVTLTAWRNCVRQSVNQNLEVSPEPQVSINLSQSDTLFTCEYTSITLDAGPRYSYLWQDGSSNQTLTAIKEEKYWVRGTNACGTAYDSVNVVYYRPQVPNVVTPNNDNRNEEFVISEYPRKEGVLKIFDRWGKEVYQSSNYANNWKAENLPDGTYFYIFQYGTCEIKKGWVQVIR